MSNVFGNSGGTGTGGALDTLTGNDSVVVNPIGNNIFVVGTGVIGSGLSTAGNLYTTGAGDTLTIQETKAQFITNYTSSNVDHAHTPYTAIATDYYISVDCSGGIVTINLPNAPTTGRLFIVKDRLGNAAIANITITTPGGIVNIDGGTTYLLNTAYEAASFLFNGTSYEVF